MADVLIKGMEMPKACGDCPFFKRGASPMGEDFIFAQPWGDCLVSGEENVIEHDISTDCPLVEVPPHGRSIDADALLPKSGYDPMMFKHKYDGDHRTQYDTLMGYEILGIVEDAPTVIEANTEEKSNGTDN